MIGVQSEVCIGAVSALSDLPLAEVKQPSLTQCVFCHLESECRLAFPPST